VDYLPHECSLDAGHDLPHRCGAYNHRVGACGHTWPKPFDPYEYADELEAIVRDLASFTEDELTCAFCNDTADGHQHYCPYRRAREYVAKHPEEGK
jgi:hypothetical protein